MAFRNIPVAKLGRLVIMRTEVNPELGFLERFLEVEIGWRVIDRISAKNDQRFNRAGIQVLDQFAQAGDVVERARLDRINMEYGIAGVAESIVYRMNQRVNGRRL